MPTVKISPQARQQFEDANGNPHAGAKLFTYAAGSTTKQATYTDSTGAAANTNPIILDSAGRTPFGLWLATGLIYKFVLAPSTDTDPPTSPIFTEDVITGVNDTTTPAALATSAQWVSSALTPTFVNATTFTVAGDQRTALHIGRRVRVTVTAGTLYAEISNSVFTTLTTVTVVMDSGALDSGLTAVDVGIVTAVNSAIPKALTLGAQPKDTSLTALTTAGILTAYTLTPSPVITAYTAGQSFSVTFHVASGAAPTIAISGVASPPNLVKQLADGTYGNIAADDITINHRSRVTLLSATQALVERPSFNNITPFSRTVLDDVDAPAWRATLGTSVFMGTVLDDTTEAAARATLGALNLQFMHVRDEKAAGTAGGDSTAGNQIRTLNTVVTNTIVGASLSANEVTLPAGTYRIHASVPGYAADGARGRLVNVTDAAVALLGTSERVGSAVAAATGSLIAGRIVITATKAFNITHFTAGAKASGLGVAVSDTFVEIYTSIMIWKE